MKIGQNIRKIRDLKGFSQDYLANKLNVSQTAIHNIEAGETKLSVDRLNKIAEVLGVPPEEIISFDDSQVFNATFQDNSSNSGTIYSFITENFEKERRLYERLLAEKDEIIQQLKELYKK